MYYMMSFVLEAVLGFLVGVFPLLVIFWLWQRREVRRLGGKIYAVHTLGAAFFGIALVGMLGVTGVPSVGQIHFSPNISLIPFIDAGDTGVQYLPNVLLFIPFGFFLPLLWERFDSWGRALLYGAGMSLAIEVAQLFCWRATDIDDWIMNTLGALIGFAIFRGLRKTAPRFVAHCRIQGGRTGIAGLEPWLILLLCWLFPLLLQPVVSEAAWSLFY